MKRWWFLLASLPHSSPNQAACLSGLQRATGGAEVVLSWQVTSPKEGDCKILEHHYDILLTAYKLHVETSSFGSWIMHTFLLWSCFVRCLLWYQVFGHWNMCPGVTNEPCLAYSSIIILKSCTECPKTTHSLTLYLFAPDIPILHDLMGRNPHSNHFLIVQSLLSVIRQVRKALETSGGHSHECTVHPYLCRSITTIDTVLCWLIM